MPYSWDDIIESAKHRAVLAIYRNASPDTKPFYQQAHYLDGKNEENWAIQWCLWHSFRMFRHGSGARVPQIALQAREIEGTPSSSGSSSVVSERSVDPMVQPDTPTWGRSDHSTEEFNYGTPIVPDSPSWRSTGEYS